MNQPDPAPHELWKQAAQETADQGHEAHVARYKELMHGRGYLLYKGDPGYDQAVRNLPCGWPHRG